MKLAILTTLLAGASAFTTPNARPAFATKLSMSEEAAAEEAPAADAPEEVVEPASPSYTCISKEAILSSPDTTEIGRVWDPLGLAEIGSAETLAWYRHSEVKHGRIAMAAFVGWWAVGAGLRFPGELSHGLEFSSIPSKGLEAWDAVPGWGKAQMLLFAGLIEFHDELFHTRRTEGGHYLRGGTPGKNMVPGLFDPFGFSKGKSEEELAKGRDREIKNGRLAMIGVAGLYCAATIPGSVPLQPPC
uniref:Fucoxanthin chlorophyll a/c protein 13 n=1 Tax=Chaetoceros neogracilis TaxID=240364 RepID=A0A6J4B2D8_9STRA|nr:Chain 13, Fucoxanthin chlorophyll a/c-binding protein Lhcq11 [Chaetoceros gracilis]6L4U_13 Chain 13, Fucoxanthin chlorophyll a/c-binding protein Lhcq11 [Chaetoceros gracilis]BBO94019.1 fucoxanthin chlorophyll a/c protein 13 [Chaetoceros gracilis]